MFTRSHSTMRYRPACAAACAVAILAVAAGASASTGNVGATRTRAAAASSDVFGLLLKWGGYGQGDGGRRAPHTRIDPAVLAAPRGSCSPASRSSCSTNSRSSRTPFATGGGAVERPLLCSSQDAGYDAQMTNAFTAPKF